MKMRTLLLVSAVAMLVSPGVVSPHHIHRSGDIHSNLNRIYYLAENCIASHSTVRTHFSTTAPALQSTPFVAALCFENI